MKIQNDKIVGIEFTLKNDAGEILDSNVGDEALYYIQGRGNIVPGLEDALAGKSEGDSIDVNLKAKDGYGEYDASLIRRVPRDRLQNMGELKVGMMLQSRGPEGEQILSITELTDTEVQLDGNHPLAGQNLSFTVRVTEVRNASGEELAHGHVHGPGGHHH